MATVRSASSYKMGGNGYFGSSNSNSAVRGAPTFCFLVGSFAAMWLMTATAEAAERTSRMANRSSQEVTISLTIPERIQVSSIQGASDSNKPALHHPQLCITDSGRTRSYSVTALHHAQSSRRKPQGIQAFVAESRRSSAADAIATRVATSPPSLPMRGSECRHGRLVQLILPQTGSSSAADGARSEDLLTLLISPE